MLKKASAFSLGLLLAVALAPRPALLTRFKLGIESVQAQGTTPSAFPLPSSVPAGTAIRVDGSESMVAINQALKQKFEAQYAGTSVQLASQGTGPALKAVLDGSIDLAAIGRPLTAAETQQGLSEAPISREKIAIIIGPNNPFKGDLTFEQFAKIFRGEIKDWSEVGGTAGPIRLIDRPESSDTRQALSNYSVFRTAPFQTGSTATQLATDDTSQVIAALGNDGISYSIANQVQADQANVQIIPMHGTLPTDPRYPYSQPRSYIYKTASPAVLAFLGYANAPAGQQAIAAARAGEAAIIASPPPVAPSPIAPSPVAPSPIVSSSITPSPAAPVPSTSTAKAGLGWLLWLILPLGLGIWWLLKSRSGPTPAVAPLPPVGLTVPPPQQPPLFTPAVAEPVIAEPVAEPVADVSPPVAAKLPTAAKLAAAGAAGLGAAALGSAAIARRSRIVLAARNAKQGYAYWEAPESEKAALRQRGGQQLTLRIADVTGLSPNQPPHSIQEYACAESDLDQHVALPQTERDYIAEIGYLTPTQQWLSLARSLPIRVTEPVAIAPLESSAKASEAPAKEPARAQSTAPVLPVVATVAAVAAAAATGAVALRKQSHIVLSPYDAEQISARWEAPESEKAELRQQGGNRFAMRLYDATGAVDLQQSVLPAVSDYDCAESAQEQTVPVPEFDHDYVAEIGYWTPTQSWLSLARSNAVRLTAPAATGLAQTAVAATKFVSHPPHLPDSSCLEMATLASVDENLPELPTSYTESQITLLPRDPQWVYAYWDAQELHKQALRQQGGQRFALRFYDITDNRQNPQSLQQYECDELAHDWYIPVPVSDRDYVAELGYVTEAGHWLLLTRSNPVRVPPVYAADWYEEEFATIDWEADLRGQTFGKLVSPAQKTSSGNSTHSQISRLTESAQAEHIAGSLFGSIHQVPAVSSFTLASDLRMQLSSGAGMSSGMGLSGIGISGIGLYSTSGMGLSGIGIMSGIGSLGISIPEASGIGMSGLGISGSGMGLSGIGIMSGVGLYSASGMGLSGAGIYTLSGAGAMSGAGLYTMSGIGAYTMSGMGMSVTGMIPVAGMSGVGMYTTSGIRHVRHRHDDVRCRHVQYVGQRHVWYGHVRCGHVRCGHVRRGDVRRGNVRRGDVHNIRYRHVGHRHDDVRCRHVQYVGQRHVWYGHVRHGNVVGYGHIYGIRCRHVGHRHVGCRHVYGVRRRYVRSRHVSLHAARALSQVLADW